MKMYRNTRGNRERDKRKLRKLHVFNKTRSVGPNSGKHVSSLVTRMLNMVDGLRYVSTETINAFSDDINKFSRSFIDIGKPSYCV